MSDHLWEQLLPGTTDVLALLTWDERTGRFANLERRTRHGSTVWQVAPPTHDNEDCWVSAEFLDGRLFANSWSCYRAEISLDSGSVLSKTFTK